MKTLKVDIGKEFSDHQAKVIVVKHRHTLPILIATGSVAVSRISTGSFATTFPRSGAQKAARIQDAIACV